MGVDGVCGSSEALLELALVHALATLVLGFSADRGAIVGTSSGAANAAGDDDDDDDDRGGGGGDDDNDNDAGVKGDRTAASPSPDNG